MIENLTNQLVNEYNLGKPVQYLAKKYHMQSSRVKDLVENSGIKLRRIHFLTEEDLQELVETMSLDELAEYLYIQPFTLKKHLRDRNIIFPIRKTVDELYIEKQATYLYLRENMSACRIAKSLNVETNRIYNIIAALKAEGNIESNRCYISSASSIGEYHEGFVNATDVANVFPKKYSYNRAY